jgi:hypothetical protein
MYKKIPQFIKNNYIVIILISLSLLLHIMALIKLGFNYSINSDDLAYIESGITLFTNHIITMHGVISAQSMPGITFLIAIFCIFFGTSYKLIIALKILWLIMGTLSIYVLYKIITLYTKPIYGLASILILNIDFIWMDNLILTETPFILTFLLLIYYSLKYSQEYKIKYFYLIILFYLLCLSFRNSIVVYPVFYIIYLLCKNHNKKILLKRTLIGFTIVILSLSPWIIRNYIVFNKFIPFTYGMGNPMLLGTYEGNNFPQDDELNYNEIIDEKLSAEAKEYINNNKEDKTYLKQYYLLEKDNIIAKYRIHYWWNKDPISFLKSYLIFKPKIMLCSTFYWDTLFNIKDSLILFLRKIELVIWFLCSIFIILNKKYNKEYWLVMSIYLYHIIICSISFAFGRYAISLFPLRYIIIGWGIPIIINKIKRIKFKHILQSNL